jgi:hypothetical protein
MSFCPGVGRVIPRRRVPMQGSRTRAEPIVQRLVDERVHVCADLRLCLANHEEALEGCNLREEIRVSFAPRRHECILLRGAVRRQQRGKRRATGAHQFRSVLPGDARETELITDARRHHLDEEKDAVAVLRAACLEKALHAKLSEVRERPGILAPHHLTSGAPGIRLSERFTGEDGQQAATREMR